MQHSACLEHGCCWHFERIERIGHTKLSNKIERCCWCNKRLVAWSLPQPANKLPNHGKYKPN